jgi:hypothetical protein
MSVAHTSGLPLGQDLSRLHRWQHFGGIDVQLVEAHVVQAEIRRRRVQRPECAVAEHKRLTLRDPRKSYNNF